MTKTELRAEYKERRQQLTPEERAIASHLVFENTINFFDLHGKTVSTFLPIERFNELNTWPFLQSVKAQFVVPVVRNDELIHVVFSKGMEFKVTTWGIPEPVNGTAIPATMIDFVLVPLLICDEKGNRVGYGKGFYDRFLKLCKPTCQFIGLSYFEPIELIDDIVPTDVPLHYCVTPENIHNFRDKTSND